MTESYASSPTLPLDSSIPPTNFISVGITGKNSNDDELLTPPQPVHIHLDNKLSHPTTTTPNTNINTNDDSSLLDDTKEKVMLQSSTNYKKETDYQGASNDSSQQALIKDNLSVYGTAPLYEILTPKEIKYILYSVYCARMLAVLDTTIVAVSLPSILSDLGGAQYLSWIVASYLLSSSVTLPLVGRLSDIYGRRMIYLLSLTIFLIASTLCGAATNIWFLVVARFLQGIGGGGLIGLTMIIPGDIAPPSKRPGIMGIIGLIAGLGALLGPVLGGGLTDLYSWRLVFYINLPFGCFAFILAYYSMKKYQTIEKKNLALDYIGCILISISTICLVLFTTWGGEDYAWNSTPILILIPVFFVSLILFLIQETKHPLPIIQLNLHKIKNVWINYVIISLGYYAMASVINYLSVYFQTVQGDRPIISGLKFSGFIIGFSIVSRYSGKLFKMTKRANLIMGFTTFIFALGLGLMYLITPTMSYGYIFFFTLLIGIGNGFSSPVSGSIIQVSVPQKDIAVAMANYSFDKYLGGCVGITISGTILNRIKDSYLAQGYNLNEALCKGLASVYLYSVPVVIVAGILGFFLDPVSVKSSNPPNVNLANKDARKV